MGNKKGQHDEALPPDPRAPYTTMQDYLVSIDLYGVEPSLEMRGQREFKSCWGAFVSLIVIIICIIYCGQKTTYLLATEGKYEFAVNFANYTLHEWEISVVSSDEIDDLYDYLELAEALEEAKAES